MNYYTKLRNNSIVFLELLISTIIHSSKHLLRIHSIHTIVSFNIYFRVSTKNTIDVLINKAYTNNYKRYKN